MKNEYNEKKIGASIVKYRKDNSGKYVYNVGQAILDGWGQYWINEEALIGLQLMYRDSQKSEIDTIENVAWAGGVLNVKLARNKWIPLDQAVESFQCVSN